MHTPGPWIADDAGEIRSEGTKAFKLVARVVFQGIKTSPNWSANARLIATAPAMLQRLEELRSEAIGYAGAADEMGGDVAPFEHLEQLASAAIAEAKGE